MYAVVRTGGKQLRVEEGAEAVVEKLDADVGDEVSFDVLYFSDGKKRVAEPQALAGAAVKAEIVEHFKGEKVVVFKFKRRKGYKRTKGHRQELTRVRVTSITAPKGAPKKAAPAKEKAPAKAEKPAEKPEKAPAKAEKPAEKPKKPAKEAAPAAKAEPAQCAAVKADGERCKNKAKPGSEYCGVHQKKYEG